MAQSLRCGDDSQVSVSQLFGGWFGMCENNQGMRQPSCFTLVIEPTCCCDTWGNEMAL